MDRLKDFVFTDDGCPKWFFDKYYYAGSNSRYWTFQMALNLLIQRSDSPVIVETGCQRMEDDLGAGMSTSIFGEFCQRYNGKLYTIDLIKEHLEICRKCTIEFSPYIEYIASDSVAWLEKQKGLAIDLLYLDSWDHPYGEILNLYGGKTNIQAAIKKVSKMSQAEILKKHGDLINPCQQHCLKELLAAERSEMISSKTLILIDDNQLPGGGKSRLVKEYLADSDYVCLFDLQQSLWIKEL